MQVIGLQYTAVPGRVWEDMHQTTPTVGRADGLCRSADPATRRPPPPQLIGARAILWAKKLSKQVFQGFGVIVRPGEQRLTTTRRSRIESYMLSSVLECLGHTTQIETHHSSTDAPARCHLLGATKQHALRARRVVEAPQELPRTRPLRKKVGACQVARKGSYIFTVL